MEKEAGSKIARLEKKSLKRVLGLGDLFAVGYGDVGSSIYYALGATALYALGATPIAMLIAGLVFICTALSYAELSTTFPEPGGSATYSRYAFNDLISFIAGWGLLLDYIVTMAISAFAIPPYLKHIFLMVGISPFETAGRHIFLTISILIGLYFINLVGVKYSGRLGFLLSLLTILTQLFIVCFGLLFLANISFVFEHMKIGVANVDWSPSWPDFLKGLAMAMVAYTGIEAVSQLAGETKNPSKSIPKAIRLTIVALIFLYFGMSVVGMSVVSPHELGTRYLDDPIAGIVRHFPLGGSLLAPWIGLLAAIILFIASNAGLLGCSRLTFSMGEYYQVPSVCYRTHPRFRTPYISLAIFTFLGCLVVLLTRGKMLLLADLYNIGAQIAFFSTQAALITLRVKRPELPRPYKAPLNISFGSKVQIPLTAIIGGTANLCVLLIVLVTKPEGRYVAIVWMLIGVSMYMWYRRKKGLAVGGQLKVEKIHMPKYAPLKLTNILVAVRAKDNAEAIQTACQLAKVNHAKLTAVYALEIPYSIPMHMKLGKREAMAEEALSRAQAIAEEYQLSISLELVRTRSIGEAISDLARSGNFDGVVIGVEGAEYSKNNNFALEARKLLADAPCRVYFCRT